MNPLLKQLLFSKKRPIISDGFNRANNALTLGNADTGQAWQALSGTWGVSNGKAYVAVAGAVTSVCSIESGVSNCSVSADATFGTYSGIVFRLSDSSNYVLARISSDGLKLFTIAAGLPTEIGSCSFTAVIGTTYNIKVTAISPNITVKLDGVERITAVSAFNSTTTKHGFRQLTNLDDKYDNFVVEAV